MVFQNNTSISSDLSRSTVASTSKSNGIMAGTDSNIIECILDEDLIILVTDAPLYKEIGYTKEDSLSNFMGLRQRLGQRTRGPDKLRFALTEVAVNGNKHLVTACPLPARDGRFLWFRLNIILTGATADSRPMFSVSLSNITGQTDTAGPRMQYLHWMMDEYSRAAYSAYRHRAFSPSPIKAWISYHAFSVIINTYERKMFYVQSQQQGTDHLSEPGGENTTGLL